MITFVINTNPSSSSYDFGCSTKQNCSHDTRGGP
ncbi:unnamed protein product, partial [Rotaria magnacalcarata]